MAQVHDSQYEMQHKSGWRVPDPMACLKVLSRKDTFIMVTAGEGVYIACSCLQASLSTIHVARKASRAFSSLTPLCFVSWPSIHAN